MSYHPEPDSHIRDKVKVVLDLSNYTTKKELDYTIGVGTSDLAAKKYYIALRLNLTNLSINWLMFQLV